MGPENYFTYVSSYSTDIILLNCKLFFYYVVYIHSVNFLHQKQQYVRICMYLSRYTSAA